MKFFIDTAHVDHIQEVASWGILDGCTTNPTLISKEKGGGSFQDVLKQICDIVQGPVSAEVVAPNAEGMIKEGKTLAKISEHIVVKIPMSIEGLKAMSGLKAEGIRTNCTLVFSANQAMMAVAAGAAFISPFIGRLDDVGHLGMDLVRDLMLAFDNYEVETELLVASVRNPTHVTDAMLAGADIVTVPYQVMYQMAKHPLTDIGIEKFLEDWKKLGATI
ncbi:MAG: fructose-6-phosphate aldolase [Candidatus Eisenbacteria sp.]|nr:fructose-6-phosphate aldolase [Candidatus Eisenbacteria bacterium]